MESGLVSAESAVPRWTRSYRMTCWLFLFAVLGGFWDECVRMHEEVETRSREVGITTELGWNVE